MKTFPDGTEHKRYVVSGERGQWLATVFLGADGVFSTVSDYGNYGYWWGGIGGDGDVRRFLCGCNAHYLTGKLSPGREYDGDATERGIRKHILEQRREKAYTKEFARVEWDILGSWASPSEDFRSWYEQTEIGDASEFYCDRPRQQAVAFVEKVMPRLCEMLRAEMAAEKAAA